MSPQRKASKSVLALLVALMVIPPIALVSSIPWLRQQPDGMAYLLGGIASTLTIASSFALSIVHDRQIDEWHRRAAQFASQWGWTAGACLVALLLAVPPLQSMVVSAVGAVGEATNPDRELVLLAFTAGFMAVVFAQLVCTALLSVGWALWMSRAEREPS